MISLYYFGMLGGWPVRCWLEILIIIPAQPNLAGVGAELGKNSYMDIIGFNASCKSPNLPNSKTGSGERILTCSLTTKPSERENTRMLPRGED